MEFENSFIYRNFGFLRSKHNRMILGLGFLLALLNTIHSKVNDSIIPVWYPDRPAPVDLILDNIPHIQPLEYVVDLTLAAMVIIFIYYLMKYKIEEAGFHMIGIASMYLVRSFLNLITPLGKPLGNESSHGIFKDYVIQYGMYPSGHVGLCFYLYLAIDKKYKKLKMLMLVLFIIELSTMLLSRGHFSIDVFGAMILSYAVIKFYGQYKESLLLELDQ